MIEIQLLDEKREDDYEEVFSSSPHYLVYQSLKYRDFLKAVLSNSEDKYLIAYEDGTPVGVLPTFVKKNDQFGPVVNSLPFFGSNGGVMVHAEASNPAEVKRRLLGGFRDLVDEQDAVASTIISNPLQPDEDVYAEHSGYTHTDERIGQVVDLSTFQSESSDYIAEELLATYHRYVRRNIRKALKSNIQVSKSYSDNNLHALARIHWNNMEAIGGHCKPWFVFDAIREHFEYGRDWRLYTGWHDGTAVGGLIVLYGSKTVEYYIPATDHDYRSLQPTSLLIWHAMTEAIQAGYKFWNWGGTWLTQGGVYNFKSRWGTQDYPYHYYICIRKPSILKQSKTTVLDAYPHYYVCPFSKLEQ